MPGFDFTSLLDGQATLDRVGLVVERGEHGVRANVPHVVYHSPAGLNFGYGGSGPADLALSVLCALIPAPPAEAEERLYDLDQDAFDRADADDALWSVRTPFEQRISRLAWRLHQSFKTTFIMTMKEDIGYVPIDIIRSWIEVQSRALQERAYRD